MYTYVRFWTTSVFDFSANEAIIVLQEIDLRYQGQELKKRKVNIFTKTLKKKQLSVHKNFNKKALEYSQKT